MLGRYKVGCCRARLEGVQLRLCVVQLGLGGSYVVFFFLDGVIEQIQVLGLDLLGILHCVVGRPVLGVLGVGGGYSDVALRVEHFIGDIAVGGLRLLEVAVGFVEVQLRGLLIEG